jgi:hypothetical protein
MFKFNGEPDEVCQSEPFEDHTQINISSPYR